MEADLSIRSSLGNSIRNIRSQKGIDRAQLSITSRINLDDIKRIEHGDIRMDDRFIIIQIIKSLDVDPHKREKIGRLVNKIYQRRRVKFHLSPTILFRRKGSTRLRS